MRGSLSSAAARTGEGRAFGHDPRQHDPVDGAEPSQPSPLYVNTSELRNRWLETASKKWRTSRDILIRVPGTKAEDISPELEDQLGRKHSTLDELIDGNEASRNVGLRGHLERIIPGLKDNGAVDKEYAGREAPDGYMWVDKNVVGEHGNTFCRFTR